MTILCYHSVEPDWESPLAVEPEAFAWQAAWLRRSRRVLPVQEALPRLGPTGRLPRGETVLTFDDGFAAVYDHAFPVLLREQLPATMFLVAQTLTPEGRPVDWVRTPTAVPLRTLTLDQVLEMQDAGVDFQSHSWAHHDLIDLTVAECVRDLKESRELLSELLGRPVTLLAYPRGLHNRQVRDAAARAGYTHAFTLPERTLPEAAEPGDRYAVPRVGLYRGNGPRIVRIKTTQPYARLRSSERISRIAAGTRRAVRGLRPVGR